MSAAPRLAGKPSLTLKRHLNAPPEKVFAAWTDPAKIIHWFGPEGTLPESVKAEIDLRVGGRYSVAFRFNDENHKVGGVYREIVPNEKLVFSWAWHTTPERESLVTVLTMSDGDGTMLTLMHEQFFDEAAAEGHKRGWTGTLNKLERYFA
jgi:uncharacterized protein YndB with AHSA1/START domain